MGGDPAALRAARTLPVSAKTGGPQHSRAGRQKTPVRPTSFSTRKLSGSLRPRRFRLMAFLLLFWGNTPLPAATREPATCRFPRRWRSTAFRTGRTPPRQFAIVHHHQQIEIRTIALPGMRLVDPVATRIGPKSMILRMRPRLLKSAVPPLRASSNSSRRSLTVFLSSRCFGGGRLSMLDFINKGRSSIAYIAETSLESTD